MSQATLIEEDLESILKAGKENVAFRVLNNIAPGSEYAHIIIQVVYAMPKSGNYINSLNFYSNYHNDKHKYKGLVINSQMSRESDNPYAYDLSVNHHCSTGMKLEEAEQVVKTLKPIHKKLAAYDEAEGYCDSFIEYVIRVSRALKVSCFYGQYGPHNQDRLNHNMGDLRGHIKRLIEENRAALGCKAA